MFIKNRLKSQKGFTLSEVIISMVISGIIGLAVATQYVADYRFRTDTEDRIDISREARIAMHRLTRVLRFAENISYVGPGGGFSNVIYAEIRGGCLTNHELYGVAQNRLVLFGWNYNGDNQLWEWIVDPPGSGTWQQYVITGNVTNFNPTWNATTGLLEITLTVTDASGYNPITLNTTVRPIGDEQ